MNKVAVVTGASKGIGAALAAALARAGYRVYDLSRSGSDRAGIRHIHCDVSKHENLAQALYTVMQETGGIDLAVSNAGFGISGSLESASPEMIEAQININLCASAQFARLVLPEIRRRRGRLVLISSVAAYVPIPFQALYSATKAAIASLAMSLDNEVRGSGARVLAILPGDLATNFTANRIKSEESDSFYRERVSSSVRRMEKDEQGGKTPEWAAGQIVKVILAKNPSVCTTLGLDYKLVSFAVRFFPPRILNYVIGKLYG